jgi:hypothetical protein
VETFRFEPFFPRWTRAQASAASSGVELTHPAGTVATIFPTKINSEALAKIPQHTEELCRFRAEAEEVLKNNQPRPQWTGSQRQIASY